VLVVDDEEGMVEIAQAYLEEMGYTTYHAQDGASALAVVEQHNDIDLIVTDILMPGGMNGVELAEKIRESLEQVKVIYCSGFPANALAERSMSLVDGPLLHKPYQRAEFGSAVRAVMEGV
jgi:CheY-like chemotaxis protein